MTNNSVQNPYYYTFIDLLRQFYTQKPFVSLAGAPVMQEQVAVSHHGADCHPAVFCALLNAV